MNTSTKNSDATYWTYQILGWAGYSLIAMSFAVASLRAAKSISIRDVANVATSFPGFVGLARSVGLDIRESAE